ncbi:MAG: SPFH domain-containing protein [Chloroflexota bacterium]|nr:SPFH domain-containing protein [Chloroflexota bacterium]
MLTRIRDRLGTSLLVLVIILLLTQIFTILLIITSPKPWLQLISSPGIILPVAFFVVLSVAAYTVRVFFIQFTQCLYALSPEEAADLVGRLIFGVYDTPPLSPLLGVREGQADPDGPETLHSVGGPGFLSIGHDSAAIVERGGIITRVLDPGSHRLNDFERVWDVVDLRPQRREVTIQANTRDGIPVSCQAEIRFRIDNGENFPTPRNSASHRFTPVTEESVLNVATSKVALIPGGPRRTTDWTIRISNGILDGEIRNRIEEFRLDEILTPRRTSSPFVETLESEIETSVRKTALKLGVHVDRVQLNPILPSEEDISQQWLESWRSAWELKASRDKARAKAAGSKKVRLARIRAQATLLTGLIENLQELNVERVAISPALVLMRFMDVTRSLAESDTMVRSTMFQQIESLGRIIESVEPSFKGSFKRPLSLFKR